ncbi:hypothetical protein P692DRAFT_20835017 [Suillus brevipes Sb2]|nr:hypothetical protein P692DRAFT_20835017 [Suillus brevipes Sb2]
MRTSLSCRDSRAVINQYFYISNRRTHVKAIYAHVYGRVSPDRSFSNSSSVQDEFDSSTNFNRALSPG